MRYIVIGAGAVGGTIGGRLHESGHEVVLVARGAHLAALRERGLRLGTPQEGIRTLGIPAVEHAKELSLRADDVLVFATKVQDALVPLQTWSAQSVAGGGTAATRLPVVCAQNGVGGELLALRRFRRVYGMCVMLPTSILEPGVVAAYGAPCSGMLHLGRYPYGVDPLVASVGADLDGSGFVAPVVADVMRWKYGKLLTNLGNAVEALVGSRTDAQAVRLRQRAIDEGTAVLDAAGIAHTGAEERTKALAGRLQIRSVDGLQLPLSSSWQSLDRGTGSIESDYLNGEIVLLGRQHGVPTPVNEVLQLTATRFAAQGHGPGGMTPSELEALADAAGD